MILELLIDSSHLFKGENISPDIDLLKGWSKTTLLRHVSRINYLIHPNGKKIHNINGCLDIWNKTTYSEKQIATKILRNALVENTIQKAEYFQKAVFFNRLTNLYIIKKILVSNLYGEHDFVDKFGEEQLINFLKFYSSCTTQILAHETAITPGSLTDEEAYAFKNLPQYIYNQHANINLSFFDLVYLQFKETLDSPEISTDFKDYFNSLGLQSTNFIKHYIGSIFHSFRNTSKPETIELNPLDNNYFEYKAVFDVLSNWDKKLNQHIFDFGSIKKFPFYKMSETEYLKLDHDFTIRKFQSTIYDDCFFDYLEPLAKEIKWYNGIRGQINEKLITQKLNNIFLRQRHIKIRFGNNLKYDSNGKNLGFEIADYYARKASKVFIAEIKSSSLTVAQLSGKAEDILSKSCNDLTEFLKKFGINQLIEHVKRIVEKPEYFEKVIPGPLKIYPCIIISEKGLNSPFIINILRDKFDILVKENIGNSNHIIKPLCVIQDSDIFRMEASRIGRFIWYILNKHGIDKKYDVLGGTLEMRLNRLGIQEIKRKFKLAFEAGYK